ncbi:heavy metal translocating P-type ATPase [Ancylobacter novellus DSM 506]|uniref:P-type Zn(2+) transporter n=1 Tax=Ancylobacter novellus (strain ATCC 8093 / DSM 506 / JCM 20403 / CCM 1077 / IAM 12100 / NBRC 12443 / NCIMB 10456) TaxID=639283 RepID=D7A9H5_ANCN5|nr:heavy metal translocating P-type ATPase [Ancylobacter novellus]ADH90737.1 heavy metal translocating P-type ATPase [Ancylobacter novellus DSM 506]
MSALKTRYRIEGMDCAACATKIDTAVRRVTGVAEVSVSVTAGTMTVEHDGADLAVLEKRVSGLGYGIALLPAAATPPVAPGLPEKAHDHAHDSCCAGHDHDHAHDDCCRHDHDHDHAHDRGHHHPDDGHRWHGESHHSGHQLEATSAAAPAALAGPSWLPGRKARLTIVCGAALVAAYVLGHFLPQLNPWIFIAALLVGLVPIARRAVAAAFAGTPFSIEMLMTIAAVGAVIIGASEEAAAVVFLFLVGELLEGFAAGRARDSIRALTALVPKTARLVQGSGTSEVPATSLRIGDVILVRPGERIPADGEVLEGIGAVNEAPVTGESVPVPKQAGDPVFAGTVNAEAALTIRATTEPSDNTIARVVRLVEEAQESKAPTERFIDRFSRYYTPLVVVLAALIAVLPPLVAGAPWDEWIYKGLAILLIGCPCALVISTPAAVAAGLASGARRGLLIKGGAVLENLRNVTAVAFDKTGTLTEGKPEVTDLVVFAGDEAALLARAAALEAGSTHPLASAILGEAAARGIAYPAVSGAGALGGEGVSGIVEGRALFLGSPKAAAKRASLSEALRAAIGRLNDEGKTVAVLLVDGVVEGLIAMRDEPRADAAESLAALKAAGIRTIMLTGDNERTANAIGADLGIEVRAGLMPADKQRIVGELKAEGFTVAKVGDGINDAPALASADVGIAMGGGTDVALETADAAVLHGRVGDVGAMVELSRATMRNIHQNITLALGLKAVFLVTTIAGITGLWPAILADTGATVLVTANALRLLGRKAD